MGRPREKAVLGCIVDIDPLANDQPKDAERLRWEAYVAGIDQSPQAWEETERYLLQHLQTKDEILEKVYENQKRHGLPDHAIGLHQGKLLKMMIQAQRAKRVLEVGTLGGYSTVFLARGVGKGGKVVTCELEPKNIKAATEAMAIAGISDQVEIREGPAAETLQALLDEKSEPFHFAFIDADKLNVSTYVDFAIRLGQPGTMIMVDNVVRRGEVRFDPKVHERVDDSYGLVSGNRKLFESLSEDPRVEATVIQTIDGKKWDGFLAAIVL